MPAPFIHLRKSGSTITITGAPSCSLGHKLPNGSGRTPDGIFVEWSWDGHHLKASNDRYGIHPCFYFAAPGELCLSPSIPQLVAEGAPTDFDDAAMAVFLRAGYFVGEDTPFRAIRALPPAATLEWTDGRLQVSGGLVLGREHDMVRNEAIDAYVTLVRQAIRRRLPPDGNFAVPLSGGRDSRHMLFELIAAGARPGFCVTAHKHFSPQHQDVPTAARVAQAVEIPHVVVPRPHSRLAAEMRKNVLTSFCADEHAWALPLADYLEGKVDVVYDGLGGNSTWAGVLTPERLSLYTSGRLPEYCDERFVIPESSLRSQLTAPQYRRWGRETALDRFILELRRHAGAPNPVGSFHFWNKGRRELALLPYGVLSRIRTVFCPYLDHDLYDFIVSIPARNLLDQAFHTEAIRRAFPQYADILFAPKGFAPETRARVRQFAREFGAYILAHGRSEMVRPHVLLPRLLQRFLDGDATRVGDPYIHAIYLLQLESMRSAANTSRNRTQTAVEISCAGT